MSTAAARRASIKGYMDGVARMLANTAWHYSCPAYINIIAYVHIGSEKNTLGFGSPQLACVGVKPAARTWSGSCLGHSWCILGIPSEYLWKPLSPLMGVRKCCRSMIVPSILALEQGNHGK